jgi:hypothetical protein
MTLKKGSVTNDSHLSPIPVFSKQGLTQINIAYTQC